MDTPPPPEPDSKPLRVAVVGPCSAGKSTLAETLKSLGFDTRQPAQEHSYVPDMWRRISRPDVLIYLDVDYVNSQQRRPHLGGGLPRLQVQQQRLHHARQHCDFYLDTSTLSPDEVREKVVAFLSQKTRH
ncbi:MAG: hypothetical protein KJ069_02705 [Anaerolineae bacterium]|nr:hypothetical protein [Anaerolineae bacterium]